MMNEPLEAARMSAEVYDSHVVKRRRLFTTELSYIGLGPCLMQSGDKLCLIYGTKVSFLIRRRREGGFRLVRECYVYGLMHGEGMTMGIEQDIELF